MYAHARTHARARTHTHTHTHAVRKCMLRRTLKCVHVHVATSKEGARARAHTHTHTRTHTHMHTRARVFILLPCLSLVFSRTNIDHIGTTHTHPQDVEIKREVSWGRVRGGRWRLTWWPAGKLAYCPCWPAIESNTMTVLWRLKGEKICHDLAVHTSREKSVIISLLTQVGINQSLSHCWLEKISIDLAVDTSQEVSHYLGIREKISKYLAIDRRENQSLSRCWHKSE